jgi:HPt (histidine-containing phosphotransfer) domain-containing protein
MDEPIIDIAVLDDLKDSAGADFVDELAGTFIEEATGMLAELRQALADQHADRFRRAAHSLKTNANTFGASRLAAAARALEIKGLDPDPAQDRAAIVALEAEYERAAAALKELCNG